MFFLFTGLLLSSSLVVFGSSAFVPSITTPSHIHAEYCHYEYNQMYPRQVPVTILHREQPFSVPHSRHPRQVPVTIVHQKILFKDDYEDLLNELLSLVTRHNAAFGNLPSPVSVSVLLATASRMITHPGYDQVLNFECPVWSDYLIRYALGLPSAPLSQRDCVMLAIDRIRTSYDPLEQI